MDSIIYLAFRYVLYHRFKTTILIFCVSLSIFLPLAGKSVLDDVEGEMRARAVDTPFVIGAKGSQFDLALHALYLDIKPPETISYSAFRFVRKAKPGFILPIYRAHVVRENKPVVGTDLSYFDFRGLELAEGKLFSRIGHCVIGSRVAQELDVSVGDQLISKPENDMNLAGATPVKMDIVGILEYTGSSDDDAVFTDIKTTWVIDGLGHGHDDLEHEKDENLFLDKDEHMATANQGVLPYIEITDENVGTIHFHGDPDDFPITAILLHPADDKSATLLEGAIKRQDELLLQMVEPKLVIESLVAKILKVKSLFDLGSLVILIVTILFLVLNTVLSMRLRQREMTTLFKMGCGRFTIFGLFFWEYTIVLLISLIVSLSATFLAANYLKEIVMTAIR